jgi:hypothetical protein
VEIFFAGALKPTRYDSLGSMTQNNLLPFHHHPCQFFDESPPFGRRSRRLSEYGKTSQKSTEIQVGNKMHRCMGYLLIILFSRI